MKDPCTDHYGEGKCEICSGSCTSDSDCAGDLVCYHRDKSEEDVPGCSWGPNNDILKNENRAWNFCK